jgi:hypothetical protein
MPRAHLRAGRRRNDFQSESVWQAVGNFSPAAEARPKTQQANSGLVVDTIEATRGIVPRQARRRVPPRHSLEELWNAVVTACEYGQTKRVGEVLAAAREAVIELQLSLDRAATK